MTIQEMAEALIREANVVGAASYVTMGAGATKTTAELNTTRNNLLKISSELLRLAQGVRTYGMSEGLRITEVQQ